MTAPTPTPIESSSARRWKPFWVAFPLLFALMMGWALASPLMSSPDEPAHAIRAAAVVRGDLTGTLSVAEPGTSEVRVPRYIADSADLTCYRGQTLESAACQRATSDDPNELVTAYTTATLNTPVFYAVVGLPTLFMDGHKALYAMRAVVALLCSALLAIAITAVCQLPRYRWTLLATIVATTPMVLFLSGTINPNAVEICASAATLALMLLTFRTDSPGRLLWERIGLLAVSVFLLVNTRSLSLFWLLFICVAALLMAKADVLRRVFSRPAAWVGTAVMGIAVGAALWWFLIPKGLTQEFTSAGAGTSWLTAFVTSLDRTFELAYGWIGVFGWLDTPAPGLTLVIWIMAAGAIVLSAFLYSSRRAKITLALTAAILLLLPAIIQASLASEWGYVWQGRYTLALFVCFLILAGLALDERFTFSWSPLVAPLATAGLVLLAVGQFAAFTWALKRYTIGVRWDTTWLNMIVRPEWQPPLGWIPLSIGYVLVLAAGVVVLRRTLRPVSDAPDPLVSIGTQDSPDSSR